jgi:hypothetical protein
MNKRGSSVEYLISGYDFSRMKESKLEESKKKQIIKRCLSDCYKNEISPSHFKEYCELMTRVRKISGQLFRNKIKPIALSLEPPSPVKKSTEGLIMFCAANVFQFENILSNSFGEKIHTSGYMPNHDPIFYQAQTPDPTLMEIPPQQMMESHATTPEAPSNWELQASTRMPGYPYNYSQDYAEQPMAMGYSPTPQQNAYHQQRIPMSMSMQYTQDPSQVGYSQYQAPADPDYTTPYDQYQAPEDHDYSAPYDQYQAPEDHDYSIPYGQYQAPTAYPNPYTPPVPQATYLPTYSGNYGQISQPQAYNRYPTTQTPSTYSDIFGTFDPAMIGDDDSDDYPDFF